MNMKKIILAALLLAAVIFGLYQFVRWTVFHQWCSHGESLQVYRKTGAAAGKDSYAGEGEQGVQEQMGGPGRHFYNPYIYNVTRVKNIYVQPGQICLVRNNIGTDLTSGLFLAGPGQKGTQKKVLTPGVWRINTFGQEVQRAMAAKIIKPGYVGVQTLRAKSEGKEKGVQEAVLQSGYYNNNPVEIRIDDVEIGYKVLDIAVKYVAGKAGEQIVMKGSGVSFPLADGTQMPLDFTVVWGIFPEDAPRIIREYGTVDMVEAKIIEPQVLSICKNAGSNLTTQEFIAGATRERFQEDVTDALKAMGKQKGIHFLIALVRGFHPDQNIKEAIQARMLAEEEKLTLKFEQERDTVAARLEMAERMVDIAIKDFDAETESIVQEEMERGKKKAAETKAQADRKVAQIERQVAEIDAEILQIIGRAEADAIELRQKAEATRFQLLVKAFGSPEAFNLAKFAESLPDDMHLEYRYAGPGTLWTDPRPAAQKNTPDMQDLAAKQILQGSTEEKKE